MVCLTINLLGFYLICKYISLYRQNWNVFYSVISLYVILSIFIIKLWLEELVFFYIVLPKFIFISFIAFFSTIWLCTSIIILLCTYLDWNFIYISNLLTNQWYWVLHLFYNKKPNLNFNWFAYQIKRTTKWNFCTHYFGNILIISYSLFLKIFLFGFIYSAVNFYKFIFVSFTWHYPIVLTICFLILIIINHFLQLNYTPLPGCLFWHSFYIDKLFYKLDYTNIDLRVNNEHLSKKFLLSHTSFYNIFQYGLMMDSTLSNNDFQEIVYLPSSWIVGKHYHISGCTYLKAWPVLYCWSFLKEIFGIKPHLRFLKNTKLKKEILHKKRTNILVEKNFLFIEQRKKQHYSFCKNKKYLKTNDKRCNQKSNN